MATKPASIAHVLDYSSSMRQHPAHSNDSKLKLLEFDVSVFVTIMQKKGEGMNQLGQVGLVKFSTEAYVLFPLTRLDASAKVREEVLAAVKTLSPGYNTNIRGAIHQGHSMLEGVDTSHYNRAMVLFSDGEWNHGGDPTVDLPTDIPIYAIGFGSSQYLRYLRTIAERTGGKYHITGNPGVLVTFYQDIIQSTKVASAVANIHQDITSYSPFQTTAQISQGSSFGIFSAAWADSSLTYTAETPTDPDQIQVYLNDPNGQMVTPDSVEAPAGGGYAVLTVNNPMAGAWTFGAVVGEMSSGGNATIGSALGAFGPPDNILVELAAKPSDSALQVTARVTDEDQPLNDLSIKAHAVHPLHTQEELLELHGKAVQVIVDEEDFDEDAHPETAALQILHQRQPELGLFRQVHRPGSARPVGDGEYEIRVQGEKKGAENTVYVTVSGHSPVSNKTFQRTQLLTVLR